MIEPPERVVLREGGQPGDQIFEEEFGPVLAAQQTLRWLFENLTEKHGEGVLLETWKSLYPQGMPQLNVILQEVQRFCDGERQIYFFEAYGCALVTHAVENGHGAETSSDDDNDHKESSMYDCRIVFPDSQQHFGTYSCGPQKFEEHDVCAQVYSRIKIMLKNTDTGKPSYKPKYPGLVHAAVCNLSSPVYDFSKKNCTVTVIDIVLSTIAFYVSQTEFRNSADMLQKALDVLDLRKAAQSLDPKDKTTIDSCYHAIRKVLFWSKQTGDVPSESYVLEQARAVHAAIEGALQSHEAEETSKSQQHVERLLQGRSFDVLPFQFNDKEMSEFHFSKIILGPRLYSSSSLCYWTQATPLSGLPPYRQASLAEAFRAICVP